MGEVLSSSCEGSWVQRSESGPEKLTAFTNSKMESNSPKGKRRRKIKIGITSAKAVLVGVTILPMSTSAGPDLYSCSGAAQYQPGSHITVLPISLLL